MLTKLHFTLRTLWDRTSIPFSYTKLHRLKHQLYRLLHASEIKKIYEGVLHDVSSPLTSLLLSLEQPALQINKEVLIETTKQVSSLVRLARETVPLAATDINILEVLKRSQLLLTHYAQTKNVRVVVYCEYDVHIFGSPLLLQQSINNLISNAIDSYDSIQTPHKLVTVHAYTKNKNVVISVHDTGCGIPNAEQRKICRPLYSTKPNGTGMGLALTRRNITKHFRGHISISSTSITGTFIQLFLPIPKNSPQSERFQKRYPHRTR